MWQENEGPMHYRLIKATKLALWSFDECFNNVLLTLLPSYHTVISFKRLLSWTGTLKTDMVLDKF